MTKENFCGACLAMPLAAAGTAIANSKNNNIDDDEEGGYRKGKNIALTISIGVALLALGIGIYYVYIKKCKTCRVDRG